MGPPTESLQALRLVPHQPPVQRAAVHLPLAGHLGNGSSLPHHTANIACYLKSATHMSFMQYECGNSPEVAGTHQPK
jgi:hypothetical protein